MVMKTVTQQRLHSAPKEGYSFRQALIERLMSTDDVD